MTVHLVTAIKQFIGHSTDVKPTDCPPGSRFFVYDTPAWFVFDGADWQAE